MFFLYYCYLAFIVLYILFREAGKILQFIVLYILFREAGKILQEIYANGLTVAKAKQILLTGNNYEIVAAFFYIVLFTSVVDLAHFDPADQNLKSDFIFVYFSECSEFLIIDKNIFKTVNDTIYDAISDADLLIDL